MTSTDRVYGMKKMARKPFLKAILEFSSTARNMPRMFVPSVIRIAMKIVNRYAWPTRASWNIAI